MSSVQADGLTPLDVGAPVGTTIPRFMLYMRDRHLGAKMLCS